MVLLDFVNKSIHYLIILVWLSQSKITESGHNRMNSETNWWSSATSWAKKQYFNGAHIVDQTFNNNQSSEIWILGRHYSSNQDARTIYSVILWFTYRQNLSFQSNPHINNDIGWGCMLRVGQMMLAQTLRICKGQQLYCDKKTITQIISLFVGSNESPYSIQNMCKIGYKLYQKKAGQWYSPSHMAYILRNLQNNILAQHQRKHKNGSKQQLKITVFDNQFQLNKALKMIGCQQNSTEFNANQSQNLLIIILFRIGFKTPQQRLLNQVVKFLKEEKFCVGILGGRPGKAHYIIGTTQTEFLYLDPHCVKNEKSEDSFFNQKMFSLDHKKIDPSMGLCFFVKNVKQVIELYDRFGQMRNKKDAELPFYSYSQGSSPDVIQISQPTQQFQVMQEE